jgi:hypothetical protein
MVIKWPWTTAGPAALKLNSRNRGFRLIPFPGSVSWPVGMRSVINLERVPIAGRRFYI